MPFDKEPKEYSFTFKTDDVKVTDFYKDDDSMELRVNDVPIHDYDNLESLKEYAQELLTKNRRMQLEIANMQGQLTVFREITRK